jgi:hypothetical protein
MQHIKEEAEALRIGILAGYVTPGDAIAWADEVIAASGVPGPEIIEVSLGYNKSPNELVLALAGIPGVRTPHAIARVTLRQMAEVVRKGDLETARKVARALYQMELDGLVSSENARAQMSRFDDAFELAETGTWGRPQDVLTELIVFLSERDEN